ncbi:hypothetical protein V8F20_004103 [Naviculisporaceae sp. PSN 640]
MDRYQVASGFPELHSWVCSPDVPVPLEGNVTVTVQDTVLGVGLWVDAFNKPVYVFREMDFGLFGPQAALPAAAGGLIIPNITSSAARVAADGSETVAIDFPVPGSSSSVASNVNITVSPEGSVSVETGAKVQIPTENDGAHDLASEYEVHSDLKVTGYHLRLKQTCRAGGDGKDCFEATLGGNYKNSCRCSDEGQCTCITVSIQTGVNEAAIIGVDGNTQVDIFREPLDLDAQPAASEGVASSETGLY